MDFIDLTPSPRGAAPANAFNIFRGDWAYAVPGAEAETGERETFLRAPVGITMMQRYFPDHADFEVLELGPHEAEHTFHLNNLPVRHVYAIEGRPANFLKCLIVKNEVGLERARFALGDFVIYLSSSQKVWDLAYCCGVLYHMADPVRVLRLLSQRCKRLVMTTAVFDLEEMRAADRRSESSRFPTNWLQDVSCEGHPHDLDGRTYTYHRRTFRVSPKQVILGHGNPHSAFANIISAATLRQAVGDVGGTIAHWNETSNDREPSVECVVTF